MPIKKEYNYFLAALQFLTRIQLPESFQYKSEYLQRASKYFPLIGSLVAALGLLVFLVVNKYIGQDLAIVSSMFTTIWITGAFHEDGFADSCDAFGGGWSKEKILLIMKDSRLGTFGVIGIIGILSVKYLLLKELPGYSPDLQEPSLNPIINYREFILIYLAAHSISRFVPLIIIQHYEYVTDPDQGKSKPLSNSVLTIPGLTIAFLFAGWPLIFLSAWYWLTWIPVLITGKILADYFKKWIGGYTGDCLGATQQVTEIIFYLSALIVWRYIL
jgi:adenosylcobinamide-GDP ribazoletransferase